MEPVTGVVDGGSSTGFAGGAGSFLGLVVSTAGVVESPCVAAGLLATVTGGFLAAGCSAFGFLAAGCLAAGFEDPATSSRCHRASLGVESVPGTGAGTTAVRGPGIRLPASGCAIPVSLGPRSQVAVNGVGPGRGDGRDPIAADTHPPQSTTQRKFRAGHRCQHPSVAGTHLLCRAWCRPDSARLAAGLGRPDGRQGGQVGDRLGLRDSE